MSQSLHLSDGSSEQASEYAVHYALLIHGLKMMLYSQQVKTKYLANS